MAITFNDPIGSAFTQYSCCMLFMATIKMITLGFLCTVRVRPQSPTNH